MESVHKTIPRRFRLSALAQAARAVRCGEAASCSGEAAWDALSHRFAAPIPLTGSGVHTWFNFTPSRATHTLRSRHKLAACLHPFQPGTSVSPDDLPPRPRFPAWHPLALDSPGVSRRLASGTPKQYKPYKQPVSERVVEISPEECGQAIDHLSKLRESYDRTKYTRPKTAAERARRAVRDGVASAVAVVRAAPGAVWRTATMSPAEWRAKMRSAWKSIKEVAHHYYVGSKLLWADVRVASRLVGKVARGKQLVSVSGRAPAPLLLPCGDCARLAHLSDSANSLAQQGSRPILAAASDHRFLLWQFASLSWRSEPLS